MHRRISHLDRWHRTAQAHRRDPLQIILDTGIIQSLNQGRINGGYFNICGVEVGDCLRNRHIMRWNNLSTRTQIDLVAIVLTRIMACGHHDTSTGTKSRDIPSQHWSRQNSG